MAFGLQTMRKDLGIQIHLWMRMQMFAPANCAHCLCSKPCSVETLTVMHTHMHFWREGRPVQPQMQPGTLSPAGLPADTGVLIG